MFQKIEKLSKNKKFKIASFVFVLLFTFVLRAHNYERVPTANHLDEMLYAWSGLYLVETGTPVSWSTLDYPKRAQVYLGEINYKGGIPKASVTLYKPWLDEPPLFSLLVGYFAHIYGADRTQFVPASYIRFPIIIISTFVSVLIFLIAKKLEGYWAGILAMLIYGTVPLFVFASRTAMPESLIAFLYVLAIYLLLKFRESKKLLYIVPIPLLAGIGGLSKPTGYFILPFAIYCIFKWLHDDGKTKKAIRYSFYLFLALVPFVAAFYIYGNRMDGEIFQRIYSIQSSRPVGFGSLAWFFITPSYNIVVLRDSWAVFCLLSGAFYLFRPKAGLKRIVVLALLYWVSVIMLSGGENDLLAWYRFPTYPLLAILGSWGIVELVRRANMYTTFLAAGMLLGNRMLLVNAFRPNVSPMTYRLVFPGLMAPSVLASIFKTRILKNLTKYIIILVVIVGILLNTLYVYQAFDVACEQQLCPIVPRTILSDIGSLPILKWLVVEPPRLFDNLFESI